MKIGHEMILASAGSGKTYALTNRFVRLLALGAQPERIVALTFTRKAAGEFFDEILKKIAGAAADPGKAARLAKDIGVPTLGVADFLKMLRAVTDAMHRLRLGTFDGFFARIAKNFPLELGLSGDFEVLQDYAARVERGRVLRQMFERSGKLSDAQKEFIEAFKRATFGTDEKRLGARLDQFIDDHQEAYLAAPKGELWGNPQQIWPEGSEWLAEKVDRTAAMKTLQTWVDGAAIEDKQRERWQEFLQALAEWSPGVSPPRALNYVLEKAGEAWAELKAGTAVLKFDRKKQELSPAACAALAQLTLDVVGGIFVRQMEITQGIHAVIDSYEAIYHDAVRRAGKLTFADVQRLLLPQEAGGRVLSVDGEGDNRLFIDFRLDAEIDHWLLDEFQDTSFGQWSVLKNLIDEVVQDPEGARSFFYVGDVKQAIYAWREGDPRLFREIFDHYNEAQPGLITERHLVESYRSGPSVIAMVNAVFGEAAAPVLTELFPGEASKAWNAEWRAHVSAKPDLGGQVALLHGEDEAARFATTLALLHEIEPLERGLTVAILVQKNSTAAELADYLRHEGGLPAVAEADLHVGVDNPLGTALLALVKAAAHPGDTLAWEHLRMTPLHGVLTEAGLVTHEALTLRLLGQIHAEGFERALDFWWKKLEPRLDAEDAFSRQRARQFMAAAGLFDATGSREVAEFVDFMARHTVRDADSAAVVRVMTVHKAKGLGFDLVILPDLEGQKLDQARDGLAVHRSKERDVEWVLDLPGKDIAANDPVLAAHLAEAEAAACYEKLSLLYVAMTRAKRAMYAVIKPPGKSVSRNFTKLLSETLGEDEQSIRVGKKELVGAYAEGDANWFSEIELVTPAKRADDDGLWLDPIGAIKSHRLVARRPSDAKAGVLAGSALFAVGTGATAADFGHAVHALLSEVAWLDEADRARVTVEWKERGEAGRQALACVLAPELAEVWRPQAGATLWREKPFEMVVDGTWVTGVFDRVIIERAANGRPERAVVYDFKTDADDTAAGDRHGRQLNLYRQAVAQLTGLPVAKVACVLVMTRTQLCVAIPNV